MADFLEITRFRIMGSTYETNYGARREQVLVKTKINSELQNQLNNQMQAGYKLSMAGKTKEAVDVWQEFWHRIKGAMISHQIKFTEDIDKFFHGQQSIFNWVMDFEMELTKAARNAVVNGQSPSVLT
jgi:hypothetical protein